MTLFEAGEQPHSCATTKRARIDSAARTDGAIYTPLAAGTRTRCDHCARALHTINREGRYPVVQIRTARVRVQHGNHDWRLCRDHAQGYREDHP